MKVFIGFFVTASFVLSMGSGIASTGETSQQDEANAFYAFKNIEVEIPDSTSIASLTDEELSKVQGGHYCPVRSIYWQVVYNARSPEFALPNPYPNY